MKKLFTLGVTLVAALSLAACGNSSGSKDSSSSKNTSSKKVSKSSSSKKTTTDTWVGNSYATKDYKIDVTQVKTIPVGEKGNEYGEKPVLAFWYKFTNITDKEKSAQNAWIMNFEAIQDNDKNKVNKLEVGMLPDDRFLDSQMEDTKKGGTVEMAIAYDLTDETTPVKIEAKNPITDKVTATKTFNLQ